MTHRIYKDRSVGPFSFPICKIIYTHSFIINISQMLSGFCFFSPQEILFIRTLLLKVNNDTILAFMILNTSNVLSRAFSRYV